MYNVVTVLSSDMKTYGRGKVRLHATAYPNRKAQVVINALTSELNPSSQTCLPRFFTGDFNFLKDSLHDVFISRSALKG
jgi:hypothetical protein